MRAIDNYTDKERETLHLKGMTAPRTASERMSNEEIDSTYQRIDTNKAQPRKADAATHSTLPWRRAGGMVEGYSIIAGDGKCVVYGKLPSSTTNLIVRAVNHADKLAEQLSHSADKLNDLSEWLKAYAEPRQAASVKAVENEAREALAEYKAAQ